MHAPRLEVPVLLNEVLSLNAQEFGLHMKEVRGFFFLNEVLSLNAQEFSTVNVTGAGTSPQ